MVVQKTSALYAGRNGASALLKRAVAVLAVLVSAMPLVQAKEWKTEKSDDGKVTVRRCISERVDDKGEEVQLIEYTATHTDSVALRECVRVVKDASKHKDFLDEEVSTLVATISAHEWIVYYFFDAPWPLPNSDCVVSMKLSEDAVKKTAVFTFTAAPSMLEDKGVNRMTYYHVTYAFKDVGNGNTEMSIDAKFSPALQVPNWMVAGWFPDGPADILQRLARLARGKK